MADNIQGVRSLSSVFSLFGGVPFLYDVEYNWASILREEGIPCEEAQTSLER